MAKRSSKTPSRDIATVLGFIRHAAARFTEANLAYGQGTFDPVEDAIFLVASALGLPVGDIDPFLPKQITAAERRRILGLIEQRVRLRIPSAYLVNSMYVQGKSFYVDKRVIVPRSYLGELLYNDLFRGDNPIVRPYSVKRVLELCTGSGYLAVLACDVFPSARVDAVDISAAALKVAAINVKRHGLQNRITLLRGDLFNPVSNSTYDVILANPPYVTSRAVAKLPAEYAHEPRLALAGGADGMEIIRRILTNAAAHLRHGGGLLCEIGRGRKILERDYPKTDFLWLDTARSSGEVFWIAAAALPQ